MLIHTEGNSRIHRITVDDAELQLIEHALYQDDTPGSADIWLRLDSVLAAMNIPCIRDVAGENE